MPHRPRSPQRLGESLLSHAVAVGRVGPHSARLWLRSEVPGPHRLEVWPLEGGEPPRSVCWRHAPPEEADGTGSVLYPDEFPGQPPLAPLRRHGFRITREADGALVGEGRFETAPARPSDTPSTFCFGVASCHQPFSPEGLVREHSEGMLVAAHRALEAHGAKLLLLCGDQLYADAPPPLSLFHPDVFRAVAPPGRERLLDCSAGEVRRLYQARYRQFWGLPGFRALQSDFATYCMLDDHEVVDNWNATGKHASPGWRNVREGALRAFADYQASRVRPPAHELPHAFDFSFDYGHTGFFVMDLRTRRTGGQSPRVYAPEQLERLATWLEAHQDSRAVFLVLSVPIIFVSSWAALAISLLRRHRDDARDRWTHPRNLPDRDRLLRLLLAHQRRCPTQRLVLLSGDVHVGNAFALEWLGEGGPRLYQLTSSALTHVTPRSLRLAAGLLPRTELLLKPQDGPAARLTLLRGTRQARHNPYGGLNLGLVEVRDRGTHVTVNLKLVGQDAREPSRPVTVFESGEL